METLPDWSDCDFTEQFTVLNIDVNEAGINEWFNADGSEYEFLSDLGVVEFIMALKNVEVEDDDNDIRLPMLKFNIANDQFQTPKSRLCLTNI